MDKVECAIVGGGVIGLSLAWQLMKSGRRDVAVFERGEIGREASWAGAGILPPGGQTTEMHPYAQLQLLSSQLHRQWPEELLAESKQDTGYHVCGGLTLARTPGEAALLLGSVETLRAEKIQVELLGTSELHKLEPALAVADGNVSAAYLLPEEAQLRNPDHLTALRTACEQRGVRFHPQTEVLDCELRAEKISLLETTTGKIEIEQVCFAGGAWSDKLLKPIGFAIGVVPIRGQMVMFKSPQPIIKRIINDGPRYLVPRRDGRLLAGSVEEEVGFEKVTTPESLAALRNFAVELVPRLADASIERTWAGLRPATYDGFPYLGKLPGVNNGFVATGHFRSGIWLSTGTAVLMADLINGKQPQIDLTPFRPGRG